MSSAVCSSLECTVIDMQDLQEESSVVQEIESLCILDFAELYTASH